MSRSFVRRLRVDAPGGAYPVEVGRGFREDALRRAVRRLRPTRVHLVSDRKVARHYRAPLTRVLRDAGVAVSVSVVAAGERSKSPVEVTRLWRDLIRAGCDRQSCVVAVGGGMVGDLAGFAAASVLRGIPFIQMPTTLLSMVDASVGGKTGINLPEGKNLVGAFHQPAAVIADIETLDTLPEREFRAGWAEVIKTAAIRDSRLLGELERNSKALQKKAPQALAKVVGRCVRIKAAVVRDDEREGGLRRILNFGHTLAHGLESVSRYGGLLHGEAVAIGMVFAARLGERLGRSPAGTAERLEHLIDRYALPTRPPRQKLAEVQRAMRRDKKRGRDGILWVLLSRLGCAETGELVADREVRRELVSFFSQK